MSSVRNDAFAFAKFFAALPVLALSLTACGSDRGFIARAVPDHINTTTKFTAAAYGVAASPRVTMSKKVRKGGGRRQLGKPYKIRGKWYEPKVEPGYDRVGNASWYGPNFHGRLTANGEVYDQFALTAAHPTFPLPSYARVTNTANGRSVIVRVNDRGPYHDGRIIDLSAKAAGLLDYQRAGTARVRVQYVGDAPLHGLDEGYLLASFRSGDENVLPQFASVPAEPVPTDPLTTGTVAKPSADPFAQEIAAVERKVDNGTTLAVRLLHDRNLQGR